MCGLSCTRCDGCELSVLMGHGTESPVFTGVIHALSYAWSVIVAEFAW